MTNEKFNEARIIKERIEHITRVIDKLSIYDYQCEPPTRDTGLCLVRGSNNTRVNLNEGEVVFLRRALETERERLEQEFNKL